MVYATLYQHPDNGNRKSSSVSDEGINEGINEAQRKIYEFVKAHTGVSAPMIAQATNIPYKSVERHVAVLIEKKYIIRHGSKKTGGYYALK